MLIDSTSSLTVNMRRRGGGIQDIQLKDKSDLIENYYQLHLSFETVDYMGGNFINSCLEQIAKTLQSLAADHKAFLKEQSSLVLVAALRLNILNY